MREAGSKDRQGCHGQGKVVEIPVLLRVREKSGNYVAIEGILQLARKVKGKSGNFVCGSFRQLFLYRLANDIWNRAKLNISHDQDMTIYVYFKRNVLCFLLQYMPFHQRKPFYSPVRFTWWRHQMETFSALPAISAGNSPAPGEFPAQWPVTRSFDVVFLSAPEWTVE